ncbi:hypothetical protein M8C21_012563 [Ambrosia artemisiifolia]|uniref:TFIIS N-terminal domain-containing protein n=1 Tax=Ambrosia artemisiifolia TaxID=4212 RepID=A0AAD5D524_AMBAR|nr:hypothetical protein M8C21_012563 [Ambrosia artemisiifolia]
MASLQSAPTYLAGLHFSTVYATSTITNPFSSRIINQDLYVLLTIVSIKEDKHGKALGIVHNDGNRNTCRTKSTTSNPRPMQELPKPTLNKLDLEKPGVDDEIHGVAIKYEDSYQEMQETQSMDQMLKATRAYGSLNLSNRSLKLKSLKSLDVSNNLLCEIPNEVGPATALIKNMSKTKLNSDCATVSDESVVAQLPEESVKMSTMSEAFGFYDDQSSLELPIDIDQYDRREQLMKSGIGKVIMFLLRSNKETRSNRKLAIDLVDTWVCIIFMNNKGYASIFMNSKVSHLNVRIRK